MDNVTHTMLGVVMAKSGLTDRFGRGTTAVLAISSNLPDLDIALTFFGGADAFLYRRTLTHSILFTPVLCVLAAMLFRMRYRNLSWKVLIGLTGLGVCGHIFFDLINSYGVVVLFPFNWVRYELAWVFIIDLVLLGLMLFPLISLRLALNTRRRFFQSALVAVVCYIGTCAASRAYAVRLLERQTGVSGQKPEFSYVFPEALGNHRFRGIVRSGDTYELRLIEVLKGRAELKKSIKTFESDPLVAIVRKTPEAKRLEWFFKAPVWDVSGQSVHVHDLRFSSLVIDRGAPFRFRFDVDQEGHVIYRGQVGG